MTKSETSCVVENFALANMGSTDAMNKAFGMLEKSTVDAMGRFVLDCERCGVKFDLDASAEEPAMRPAAVPENIEDACLAVTHYRGGEIMALDRKWFGVFI